MRSQAFGLKTQPSRTIYRLPPGEFSSAVCLVDDILYPVAAVVMIGIIRLLRVTLKALI